MFNILLKFYFNPQKRNYSEEIIKEDYEFVYNNIIFSQKIFS